MDYAAYIASKKHSAREAGFSPTYVNPMAFDFQNHLIEWSLRSGRSATFADCGLGKTLMYLSWAQNVIEHTNKSVLVLAPLSVTLQIQDEADKFGFDITRSKDGSGTFASSAQIVVTNYERLHYFNSADFSGVVCDESSILKNFDGQRKGDITRFMRSVPYRSLFTATAAPNDYIELGTSSEALGHMGYTDMLLYFFKNDEDSLHPAFIGSKWRFKRHAEQDFWRWLCSWARACRRPSDLGFDDGEFVLPKLIERQHTVGGLIRQGEFLQRQSATLSEQREDNKATMVSRCESAAELLDHDDFAVAWCHTNAESDLLTKIIKDAVPISGSDSDDRKEEVFEAFRHGKIKKLVTKPKIAAFGLNWQHCAHMTYFPDHSYEQYYQATRRLWRFGQQRNVIVDAIYSASSENVFLNMTRKAKACDVMFESIVRHMAQAIDVNGVRSNSGSVEIPSWL